MKKFTLNFLRPIGKIFLWIFSIALLLVILSQLALWTGILWLNSDKGSQWAQANINVALKDSAYSIDLKDFYYRPLTTIKVGQFNISDHDGTLAKIRNAHINVDILSLPMKKISFSLRGDTLKLLKLPQSKENSVDSKKITPFTIPDLYFNKITISEISIQNLEILESISGEKVNLSPKIMGALSLDKDKFAIELRINPDVRKITNLKNIPNIITLNAEYDAQKKQVLLNNLEAKSELYYSKITGAIDLLNGQNINISGILNSDNFSSLNQELKGNLQSNFKLSGTTDSIKINSDGTLHMEQFESNSISPVSFNISSTFSPKTRISGLKAHVKLASSYQNLPITLNTEIMENDGDIIVEKINTNDPDITINGHLKINPKTTIVEGDVSAIITDFKKYKALIKQNINASGKVTFSLSDNEGLQKITTASNIPQISYNDISISGLNLKTITNDIKNYKATDIYLNLKKVNAGDLSLSNITSSLKESNDSYKFKINSDGQLDKDFSLQATSTLINLTSSDKKPRAESINAIVKIRTSAINIKGTADSQNIDLNIDTNNLSLHQLPITLPQTLKNITLSATTSVQGLMSSPVITSNLNLSPLSLAKNTPSIKLTIDSTYKDNIATVNIIGNGAAIKQLEAHIKTPVTLSLNPFIFKMDENQAISGNIGLALQAKEVVDQLLPPQYDLAGNFKSNISIGGTIKSPLFTGSGTLTNGVFSDKELGIALKNINLSALLDNRKIILQNLSANDNKKGKLNALGEISLDNYMLSSINLSLNLKDLELLKSDVVEGVFNADITASGTPNNYNINGIVKSDYIDIKIPEKYNQSIPELNTVTKDQLKNSENILDKIELDLLYIADNHIFVRGWGLDAEFGGKISIKGSLRDPQFNGHLQSNRGRYEEFGQRFKLAKANLNFLGTIPPSPNLDITAETKIDDIMAQVNLTGSIIDPKIIFSSSPSLPEDEILSLILFDRDLSTISPFQAVQLAQTLRRLSGQGGGGFDPLAKIRNATGVDDLHVETDKNGQANVGVGKYLTDKVYLEFEKGTGENSGAANLEIEVTPDITVESEIGQNSQSGAGVFWQWDY